MKRIVWLVGPAIMMVYGACGGKLADDSSADGGSGDDAAWICVPSATFACGNDFTCHQPESCVINADFHKQSGCNSGLAGKNCPNNCTRCACGFPDYPTAPNDAGVCWCSEANGGTILHCP